MPTPSSKEWGLAQLSQTGELQTGIKLLLVCSGWNEEIGKLWRGDKHTGMDALGRTEQWGTP